MYIALWKANKEKLRAGELHGLCSCGSKFPLVIKGSMTTEEFERKNYELRNDMRCARVWDANKYPVCPKCGAKFGFVTRTVGCYIPTEDGPIAKKESMVSVTVDGDSFTIVQEQPNYETMTDTSMSIVSTGSVTFNTTMGLTITGVCIDGKDKKPGIAAIKKVMGGVVTGKLFCEGSDLKIMEISRELDFFCQAARTENLGRGLELFMRYPVLDALYLAGEKEWKWKLAGTKPTCWESIFFFRWEYDHWSIAHSFTEMIKNKEVNPNEHDIAKAFNIEQVLVPFVVRNSLPIEDLNALIMELGLKTTIAVLDIADDILIALNTGMSYLKVKLCRLLAELSGKERAALKEYLTRDVIEKQALDSVYATSYLLGYIEVAKTLKTPYELCPASLKLQFDLIQQAHDRATTKYV